MTRWISIGAGLLLLAVAFLAASMVADSRQGLVAEVVTLLAGLAGTGLLLYGLVPKRKPSQAITQAAGQSTSTSSTRSANDLVIGAGGLLVAAALLAGLVVSGGWLWALFGAALLLPMMIGCAYLCATFIRAPTREWRIDLGRISRR